MTDWLSDYRARQEAVRAEARAEAEAIRTCPLVSPGGHAAAAARGALRACWMCGQPLPPRRQKWCSDDCATGPRGWFTLHEWSRASNQALIRDQFRCRRCGDRAGATRHHWQYLTDRGWSKYEDCWDPTCTEPHGVSPGRLQVDHIVPRPPGQSITYAKSCGHHPENLQTLCIPCHAIKGVIYRSIMEALRRASVLALPSGSMPVQMTIDEAMQLGLGLPDEAP